MRCHRASWQQEWVHGVIVGEAGSALSLGIPTLQGSMVASEPLTGGYPPVVGRVIVVPVRSAEGGRAADLQYHPPLPLRTQLRN